MCIRDRSYGGHYKTADNVIAETDTQGNKSIRFQPLPAWETPEAVDSLCRAYEEAVGKGDMDPLLLIPMFILDFLCIHPFNDGNVRMSRLLTLLLLYRAGYIVGKYISICLLYTSSPESGVSRWWNCQNAPSPASMSPWLRRLS